VVLRGSAIYRRITSLPDHEGKQRGHWATATCGRHEKMSSLRWTH